MKKTFCDVCNKEIKKDPRRITTQVGTSKLGIDISPAVAGLDEADVCIYCIIDAFSHFDDRDRPSRAE